jgi:hypothetical protein
VNVISKKAPAAMKPAEALCFAFRDNELLDKLGAAAAKIPRIDDRALFRQPAVALSKLPDDRFCCSENLSFLTPFGKGGRGIL